MPSSVGHALAGVAAAWTADLVPGARAGRNAAPAASLYRRAGGGLTLACLILPTLPDADLLFHTHRTYTHSVGAVAVVGLAAALVAALLPGRPVLRVALTCAAAYATHLALDWLSVDTLPPYGLQAWWPFSDAWVISGWDLFAQTERRHFLSAATIWINAQAVAREVAILAPLVLALWLVRVKALARFPAQIAGRHHPAE
jgi:membrane-bound metal-dependent hydrolase YbcI (DUF457 family)